MYIPINKKRGAGLELSTLQEWADDNYADDSVVGFDIIIRLFVTLHLLALSIRDNHIGICCMNAQLVFFWSD